VANVEVVLPLRQAQLSAAKAIAWARAEVRRMGRDPIGDPTLERVPTVVTISGFTQSTWRVAWSDAKDLPATGVRSERRG
jgi:hypothetical protein